ncbi:MAG TPA: hypothetical protein VJV39_26825 [Dongiaceae bacterium]|nr:hypothetical protein [Dongiaceae bacterium]
MSLAVRPILFGAMVSLTACTTPYDTMPPGPWEYRLGYRDGCDEGYAYAGSPLYRQTSTRPAAPTAEPYRSGWLAGFDRCLDNYQHFQRTVNFLIGPPLG